MLGVTPRFLAALTQSHLVSVAAQVYRPSQPTVPIDVPVIGGRVTVDRDAMIRRQASLEVAFSLGDELTRDTVRELPFGGEAVIERGIRYGDGNIERVQLGRFRVESVVWEELQGRATLTLADRMAQVQDERFLTPWIPVGTPSQAAVAAVYQVYADRILYHVETTPATEPQLHDTVYEEDRAAAVSDLAGSVGARAYFNNLGDFVLRPRDFDPGVVWTLAAGEGGTMLSAVETLDRSSVRNGIAVRGQAAADLPPVTALALNTDPNVPTRWGGPFGHVPLILSSTAVSSQQQAQAAANAQLSLRLGLSRTVTLAGVPNPALEPDDTIELVFPDGRREQQSVNAISIPLDPAGPIELTTASNLYYVGALEPARPGRVRPLDTTWREQPVAT